MNIRVPEVQTFCCCISLRTGAKLLGFLSLVASLFLASVLIWESIMVAKHFENPPTGWFVTYTVEIILQFIQTTTSVCLLLGVYQGKAKLIPPWLVSTAVIAVAELIFLSSIYSFFYRLTEPGLRVNWILLTILQMADDVYGWLVVYSFYRSISQNTDQMQSLS